MIEEPGRVVAVEASAVWVETRRSSSCASCSARGSCGEGLLERIGVQQRHPVVLADTDLRLQVGDSVIIGIPEDLLLSSSLQIYLLPLLGLLAGSLLLNEMNLGEPAVIIGGLTGMSLVWWQVRRHLRRHESDSHTRPRVLRAGPPLHGQLAEEVQTPVE